MLLGRSFCNLFVQSMLGFQVSSFHIISDILHPPQLWSLILLIARTTQLAKYPRVLHVKPSNEMYVSRQLKTVQLLHVVHFQQCCLVEAFATSLCRACSGFRLALFISSLTFSIHLSCGRSLLRLPSISIFQPLIQGFSRSSVEGDQTLVSVAV